MFWRFGSYANISTIETLLDKPDVTLEELLDEADLLQELKQHNTKLIEFLRDENVLGRMLEYVIDPKATYNHEGSSDDLDEPSFGTFGRAQSQYQSRETDEARRSRLSCEILSSGTWSLAEALMQNLDHMRMFWSFLEREPPLDPVQAAYFTKVNETLLDKKTEEMMAFFVSIENIVPTMLKHVECPMIMDLLLKIISMEKAENGAGIVDWLQSRQLIPMLLAFLSPRYSPTIQTSTGDFLKAIITISANASQHEQSCIGPNDLTRQLVSEPCIKSLIQDMLKGGNPLTVGVGIVIEVIRKNNSDYDPENLSGIEQPPSGRDPIYLGTLLRLFAAHVPDFMGLVMNQNDRVQNPDGTWTEKKRELKAAYGGVIEPLGFNRFKTCELMAELLHCSNMALLNEKGSDQYVKERDKERERLKALREKAKEGQKEMGYSQDLGGFRYMGVMGEKGPLEVQNGDDNSSEDTNEDDGFEDVGAEELLVEEEIRPLRTGARVEAEDEDVELLSEDEPEAVPVPTGTKAESPQAKFFGEPSSPPKQLLSSLKLKNTPTVAVPTVEITGPTGEQVPPVSPKSTPESITEDLAKVTIKNEDKSKELPPLPTDVDSAKAEPFKSEGKATASQDIQERSSKGGEESSEDRQGTTQDPSPAKSSTSPSESKPSSAEGAMTVSTVAANQSGSTNPGTQIASVERRNAELPPLPAEANEGADPQQSKSLIPTQAAADVPLVSPFSDPADIEIGPKQASSGVADSISVNPEFKEFVGLFEADYDGNPVVGDYLKMQFVKHRVVITILDFFFRFPWNNFLHNVVYDVVQQVFNGPMERGFNRTLAIDLFATGRITERIMEGQRFSDKTQRETRMRMGYMGHLTLIAEEVVKFTKTYPPETLSQVVLEKVMHPDWIDYVENVLSETRERDNAMLGGFRPDQSLGPRSGAFGSIGAVQGLGGLGGLGGIGVTTGAGMGTELSVAELDTIDLANGTGGVGADGSDSFGAEGSVGLGASSGTGGNGLVSGFGSSSDEDEDDLDRDEEDEDARLGNMGGMGMGSGSGMNMGIGNSSGDTSSGGTAGNDQFVKFLTRHINNVDNATSSDDDDEDELENDSDDESTNTFVTIGRGTDASLIPAPLNVRRKQDKDLDEKAGEGNSTERQKDSKNPLSQSTSTCTPTILPDTTFQRKNKLGLMLNSASSNPHSSNSSNIV